MMCFVLFLDDVRVDECSNEDPDYRNPRGFRIARYIDTVVTETSKFGNAKTPEPLQIEQFQTPRLKDNRLACALGYVRIFSDDVIIT